MKSMIRLTPLVLALSFTLGCSSTFDPNFGNAVKNNVGAQAIDFNPGYDNNTASLDGQKAEKLLDEYREERPDVDTQTLIRDLGD